MQQLQLPDVHNNELICKEVRANKNMSCFGYQAMRVKYQRRLTTYAISTQCHSIK